MTRKLYERLGVAVDADAKTIKKAFRRLAQKHHPDRNPGDADAERRFKEVSEAHDVLTDDAKRPIYDRFGDAMLEPGFDARRAAAERSPFGRGRYAGGSVDVDELLGELFGARPRRGRDVAATLSVDFDTAVRGGERALDLGGRRADVRIPPGVRDGETLKLRGLGTPGQGGPPGDLLVTLAVSPHAVWQREGEDLVVRVPITVGEAVRGAAVEVPTLTGPLRVKVPPHSQTGRRLLLRGKGVARRGQVGDLFAELVVVVPEAANVAALGPALDAIDGCYGAPVRQELLGRAQVR